MAAETVAKAGHRIVIVEQMPSPARKFLMAGRSGLNLTHSEPQEHLLDRYGLARPWLHDALTSFSAQDTIAWANSLGQPCFTGTSGRIFPKSMKASPLLRAWLARLETLGVTLRTRTKWIGWNTTTLTLETPNGPETLVASAVILATGGASWPRLGTDGHWTHALPPETIAPFRPANCGFTTTLPPELHTEYAGHPLKRIALTFSGQTTRGDLMLTPDRLEGNPLYLLSAPLRNTIEHTGTATLHLDLRPDLTPEAAQERLAATRPRESLANRLRKAYRLDPLHRALLRTALPKNTPDTTIATTIKALPITLTAPAPIDRAISTAGGLRQSALTPDFMLIGRPGTFAAGEMLDWEAPTGGYLLQACLATGKAAGQAAIQWLAQTNRETS